MKKSFVYGMFVEGDNFTDRVKETHRLKNGLRAWYECDPYISSPDGKDIPRQTLAVAS